MGLVMRLLFGFESKNLKDLKKGRTAEQKKVLDYFLRSPGLLKKNISDSEYDAIVMSAINSLNIKQMALSKLGIDEDQVKEIEPVHFESYCYGDNANVYTKRGDDRLLRSSSYQVSWLFFSDSQVYIYQYTLNLDENGKKERTEEYFYKDVTNFASVSESIVYKEYPKGCISKGPKDVTENVNRFSITVSGDKFYCALDQNDYTEKAISGMKAKLREKKS